MSRKMDGLNAWMHVCTHMQTHTHGSWGWGCSSVAKIFEAKWKQRDGLVKLEDRKQLENRQFPSEPWQETLVTPYIATACYVKHTYKPSTYRIVRVWIWTFNHILSNPPSYTSVSQVVSHSWPGIVGRKVINYKTDRNGWYQVITQEY